MCESVDDLVLQDRVGNFYELKGKAKTAFFKGLIDGYTKRGSI